MASDPRRRNQILLTSQQNVMMEDEDEDEDELFAVPEPSTMSNQSTLGTASSSSSMPAAAAAAAAGAKELVNNFITPSPFPHHTTGATSSRFRNAFTRITTNPTSDVEAWQALMTEVANCYRSIQSKIHVMDAEIQLQLDWIESCYGTLLKYFPYSTQHYSSIAEIMYAQSAMVGEEHGPLANIGLDYHRQRTCQAKLEHIFYKTLGITMDGTKPTAVSLDNHSFTENGDQESQQQQQQQQQQSQKQSQTQPSTMQEEENATALLGGMCTASVELWLLYVRTRMRQAHREHPHNDQVIRQWTTQAYELALEHAAFGFSNHLLWKAYLHYVKSTAATDPQHMITLRNLYQRLVCHPMTGLDQLWQEYEQFERQQSEALAQALIGEFTPKYQHARSIYLERNRVVDLQELQADRLATPPNMEELSEEHSALKLWKTRIAYERTNPERVQTSDWHNRIRTTYKEMACAWTQHPEVWHMWSMWEETTTGQEGVDRAIAVLKLGQIHIPDCTLLVHAQAQLVELRTSNPSACLQVMKTFLDRAPNTLGYSLYQQMVRRYKGKDAARAVFAKARRVLSASNEGSAASTAAMEEVTTGEGEEAADVKQESTETGKRWMVTNRLDESVGSASTKTKDVVKEEQGANTGGFTTAFKPGPITWHLYANHAVIEHRLNNSPDIAARTYELGLRKHASFLTQPAYVLRYAQLLLELQDTVNLRALLTRALAACKNSKSPGVAALWDMTLQFESLVAIGDPTNMPVAAAVERKRRAALMGPEVEDVATGLPMGLGDSVTIGAQKSTVAEQLVRQDGYEMSSAIVNGISRAVDVLDIMGLWGSGNSRNHSLDNGHLLDNDDASPGGKSDAAYQKRLNFTKILASGMNPTGGEVMGDTGSRILSARERLQGASAQASQNTAITMAIQNSPEWLRSLLMMLPASRLRTPVLSKPPPHVTERALAILRQAKLPAERPQDDQDNKLTGGKHKLQSGGDGDSSDEEGGNGGTGGYGTQFRARQRARQMTQTNGM